MHTDYFFTSECAAALLAINGFGFCAYTAKLSEAPISARLIAGCVGAVAFVKAQPWLLPVEKVPYDELWYQPSLAGCVWFGGVAAYLCLRYRTFLPKAHNDCVFASGVIVVATACLLGPFYFLSAYVLAVYFLFAGGEVVDQMRERVRNNV